MAVKPRSKKPQAIHPTNFRPSWRGQLRFGLVAFGVQAVNAEIREKGGVHFHLLHEPDHQRIHYAKICPKHGEVPNSEIIEGYEYGKGQFVEFQKEELNALRTEREKALTLDSFIEPEDLDPIFFDGRMYYLIPDGSEAAEPYSLLVEGMKKLNRWGVGQVVFSGREQLVVVRPIGGLLNMAMLSYRDEIRKPEDFEAELGKQRATPRMVKLAEDLIRNWTEKDFDLGEYHDHYRQKVKELVEAKVAGREVVEPEQEDEPKVVNLMEALKRSVGRPSRSAANGTVRSTSAKGAARHRKRRA